MRKFHGFTDLRGNWAEGGRRDAHLPPANRNVAGSGDVAFLSVWLNMFIY